MKKFIIPILFFIGCIGGIIFVHREAFTTNLICGTLDVDNTCLVNSVNEMLMNDPSKASRVLIELASLRRQSLMGGDFRIYGLALHHIGAMYMDQGISFSIINQVCPPLLKDGCVHGYVMEYIRLNGIDQGKLLCGNSIEKRARLGCFHALGHSYLETSMITLSDAITHFCGAYQNSDYVACVSGLFHEYTKGGEMAGMDNYYDRTAKYVPLPCLIFSGNLQVLCYGGEGSFRQYYSNSESITETDSFCQTAPTPDDRNACRYEAAERINLSKGYSAVMH
jgi:hypothetical protein